MKTGNTGTYSPSRSPLKEPQWSPVMKTGNTHPGSIGPIIHRLASMEPGHEDREYLAGAPAVLSMSFGPQWSPVMKTGNTGRRPPGRRRGQHALMEPGHEDREYHYRSPGR